MILFIGYSTTEFEQLSAVVEQLAKQRVEVRHHNPELSLPEGHMHGSEPSFMKHVRLKVPYAPEAYRRLLYLTSYAYREILEAEITAARPDAIVWCPGNALGSQGRVIALQQRIAVSALLPPTLEFTEIRPFSLGPVKPEERFICAGRPGIARFRTAGAPVEQIFSLGSTTLNSLASMKRKDSSHEIIWQLADSAPSNNLTDAILQHAKIKGDLSLIVRRNVNSPDTTEIVAPFKPHARVRISSAPPAEDLAGARLWIGESALGAVEAVLAGVPAIVWSTATFPSEISGASTELFFQAQTEAELAMLIDMIGFHADDEYTRQLRQKARHTFLTECEDSAQQIAKTLLL